MSRLWLRSSGRLSNVYVSYYKWVYFPVVFSVRADAVSKPLR
jgi:hypothetical protein